MNHAMQIIQSPESSSNQGLSWDTAASQGSCKPLAMATPKSAAANAGPSLRPSPNIQTVPWGRGESRSNFLQRQKISKNLWLWCRLLACGAWHVLPMFTSWKFYEDKHYIFFLWFFGFSSLLPTQQLQVPCLFGLRGGDLPSLPTKCAFGATFSRGVLRPFSRSCSPPRIQFSLSPGVIFDRLLQGSGWSSNTSSAGHIGFSDWAASEHQMPCLSLVGTVKNGWNFGIPC